MMHTVAGRYEFGDPKYIYVRAGMAEPLEVEVSMHEAFHRTFTTGTVYGTIFGWLDHLLRKHGDALPAEDRQDLGALRNRLFQNMYFVQEGGAVTRAWAFQSVIYPANSQEEANQVVDNYLDRLPPDYRAMGERYAAVLFRLLTSQSTHVSPFIFTWANDALAYFLMNPRALAQSLEVSLSAEDSILLTGEVAPHLRFETLEACVRDADAIERFSAAALRHLKQELGWDSFADVSAEQVRRATEQNIDSVEPRVICALHLGLEAVLPDFAITQVDFEAFHAVARWFTQLDQWSATAVPGYTARRLAFASTQKDKEEALKMTRYIEDAPDGAKP